MKTKHNVLVWNLQPGTTDITQPVDSGYGRAVKRLIGVKLAQWLENDDNLEKWETGKITASDRRILLTIWVPYRGHCFWLLLLFLGLALLCLWACCSWLVVDRSQKLSQR